MDFKAILELWNKPEEYSTDEISILKKYIKSKNYKVKYGFYNKESSMGKQVAFIIDTIPNMGRRTGSENNWTIISERNMTSKEIEEYIMHYFRSEYKRFLVFYYKNIDKLIYDDQRLEAETPTDFIEQCRIKGYSGSYQLKIEC
jgi:hypothetical protein